MEKTVKLGELIKTHRWCIILIMILTAFCFIKGEVDQMVMEHQKEQIEKYQAQAKEYQDAYWQMVDEKNRWRDCAERLSNGQ